MKCQEVVTARIAIAALRLRNDRSDVAVLIPQALIDPFYNTDHHQTHIQSIRASQEQKVNQQAFPGREGTKPTPYTGPLLYKSSELPTSSFVCGAQEKMQKCSD